MINEYQELVEEIRELTGAAGPALMEHDAPVLGEDALRAGGEEMYIVAIIGGKDVGKSALVNALVGQEITPQTSFGPGTESAIAYAHEDQKEELAELLQREAPGHFRIVTHRIDRLKRQVLLDLPDIDSHYRAHIELTRRILRHVLFPIWLQSVEKYADKRPQELLASVAMGNAPQNFIFALNKVDQLAKKDSEAAREIAADFSRRVGSVLKIKQPQVWMISAIQPGKFDLPDLQKTLAQERSEKSVDGSRKSAVQRQGLSLSEWVARQELQQRLSATQRLSEAAEEEVASRLGSPLLDSIVPKLQEDPAYRLALADELMSKRVARWPVVNVIHVLLGPIVSIARRRLPVSQQNSLESADEMVRTYVTTAGTIQSTFAFLHQSNPAIAKLYGQWKLWESMPAQLAEDDLRRRLSGVVERQRSKLREAMGEASAIGGLFRWLLTIGALLWFPIIQPVLQAFLEGHPARDLTLLGVKLLGVTYLLKTVAFLAIYFVVLWMILRWDTQRRIDRFLWRWREGRRIDPALSLAGQAVEWLNELLAPIRSATERLENVVKRSEELKKSLDAA